MKGPGAYFPVFIPANTSVRVDTAGMDDAGTLKLDVVSGGPVFGWFGRVATVDAIRFITPAQNNGQVHFDMACSSVSDFERPVSRGVAMVSLFALADTIAYLQFTPHKGHEQSHHKAEPSGYAFT